VGANLYLTRTFHASIVYRKSKQRSISIRLHICRRCKIESRLLVLYPFGSEFSVDRKYGIERGTGRVSLGLSTGLQLLVECVCVSQLVQQRFDLRAIMHSSCVCDMGQKWHLEGLWKILIGSKKELGQTVHPGLHRCKFASTTLCIIKHLGPCRQYEYYGPEDVACVARLRVEVRSIRK
jgi:hypothetical protein